MHGKIKCAPLGFSKSIGQTNRSSHPELHWFSASLILKVFKDFFYFYYSLFIEHVNKKKNTTAKTE